MTMSSHASPEQDAPGLDRLYTQIQHLLAQEQEAGRVNSLEAFHARTQQRECIARSWQHLTRAYRALEKAMKLPPALPVWEQIQWAQAMLALPNLSFLEIDTTGLDTQDEIIRFTLLDAAGEVIEDCFIRPASCTLGEKASEINGIKPEQLEHALPLKGVWERIEQALRGRYILSFNQEWDVQQLHKAAELHQVAPVLVLGDCLQRHATSYYHGEYYLTLAEVCARVGSPLPKPPQQESLDRARGQRAVLQAFAQAVTDLRPLTSAWPKMTEAQASLELPAGDDFDPFLDTDDLP